MSAENTPRYAVYFAPEPNSELDAFGSAWLGRNMDGTAAQQLAKITALDKDRRKELTEGPRRYGFHGTLKPPFELNPSTTIEALLRTAHIFARGLSPVEIPPLELAVIGKFIALTPTSQSAELEKLSAACVRAFEAFRGSLTEEHMQYYRSNKLTVHQEQMLEHWGYPYVMEEFQFHMSLTDRMDDAVERDKVFSALETLVKPVVGKPTTAKHLTVVGQKSKDQPMIAIERIPFGKLE